MWQLDRHCHCWLGMHCEAWLFPNLSPPCVLPLRQAVCPGSGQQGSMFKMGSVGTCLSKAVAGGTQLTEGCRALVLVRLAGLGAAACCLTRSPYPAAAML